MTATTTPVELPPAADSAPEPDARYVGLATRTIAFAIDAAIINGVALAVELGAALILSLFHLPNDFKQVLVAIGAGAWVIWSIAYFVVFWSTTGVTPGNRIMLIRVEARDGRRIKPRRALLRCAGLVLSAIPLFAGYVMILFDRDRRAFHDRLARTIVVESPAVSLVEARRVRRRAERELRSSDSGDDRGALASQT